MKVKIITEIDVPEEASHFTGEILHDPTWYKCKMIAGYPHWFYYEYTSHFDKGIWELYGHSKPFWVKDLRSKIYKVIDKYA